jgi:uroporphyrinogen-III decarboxylase
MMDKRLTSKRLVRGAFESADLPRLPFIPWVFTHAARLEQVPVRRMFADPTQYTKCLQNARKLYGYDAIIGGFDASLEMEICGYPVSWRNDYEVPATSPRPEFDLGRLKDINVENAARSGRFGTIIESLRRIKLVSGQDLALAAVVTGPLSLLAGLTGSDPLRDLTEKPEEAVRAIEAAAAFLLKVVQVYCQLELDVIVIADRLIALLPAAHLSRLPSVLSPIINLVRFYNTFSVLLPGEPSPDNLSGLIGLGFDAMVAAGIDAAAWHELKGGRSCVLGKAIPARVLNSGPGELPAYLATNLPERVGTGVFITTDWEVPPETPPDNIHLVMRMISGH